MSAQSRMLPLGRDPSSRFLPFVLAVMVFVSVLGLTVVLLFWQGTETWRAGLSGTVTVQIKPLGGAAGEQAHRADTALALLRETPGVASAELVSKEDVRAMLAPWLGGEARVEGLPLPLLIDVTLSATHPAAAATLTAVLTSSLDGVVVEDHGAWFDRIARLAMTLEAIAFAVTGLICISAVAIIVVSTRTGMIIHADIIELLHLIGAQDGRIAGQFQRQAFIIGLKAALMGVAAALGTIFAVGWAGSQIDPTLVPAPTLTVPQWAVLAATPVAIAVLVAATARITVMRRLRRLL